MMLFIDRFKRVRSKQNTNNNNNKTRINLHLNCIYSQATLAPVALDLVRQKHLPELHTYANIVLIVSVLAIILTAPLGAILMVKFAPKFLLPPPNDGR